MLIVLGMWLIFSGGEKPLFKVAVFGGGTPLAGIDNAFLKTRYMDFTRTRISRPLSPRSSHNQIDMLLDLRAQGTALLGERNFPQGYVLEKILAGETDAHYTRDIR